MRMESEHAEPDWEEGVEVVPYAGTLITVYFSASESGVEVDGIEHAGLVLDANDLSDDMRESLVRSLRAQFDAEGDE